MGKTGKTVGYGFFLQLKSGLEGISGKDGKDGQSGKDGKDGKDGIQLLLSGLRKAKMALAAKTVRMVFLDMMAATAATVSKVTREHPAEMVEMVETVETAGLALPESAMDSIAIIGPSGTEMERVEIATLILEKAGRLSSLNILRNLTMITARDPAKRTSKIANVLYDTGHTIEMNTSLPSQIGKIGGSMEGATITVMTLTPTESTSGRSNTVNGVQTIAAENGTVIAGEEDMLKAHLRIVTGTFSHRGVIGTMNMIQESEENIPIELPTDIRKTSM